MAYSDYFNWVNVTRTLPGLTVTGGTQHAEVFAGANTLDTDMEFQLASLKAMLNGPEYKQAVIDGQITCAQIRDYIVMMVDDLGTLYKAFSYQFTLGDIFGGLSLTRAAIPEDDPAYRPGVWEYWASSASIGINQGGTGTYIEQINVSNGGTIESGDLGAVITFDGFVRITLSASGTGDGSIPPARPATISSTSRSFGITISNGYRPELIDALMPDFCPYAPPVAIGGGMSFNPITPEERENDPFLISVSNPPTETVILFANHTYELNPIGMRGK